jgi:hypothetical protein
MVDQGQVRGMRRRRKCRGCRNRNRCCVSRSNPRLSFHPSSPTGRNFGINDQPPAVAGDAGDSTRVHRLTSLPCHRIGKLRLFRQPRSRGILHAASIELGRGSTFPGAGAVALCSGLQRACRLGNVRLVNRPLVGTESRRELLERSAVLRLSVPESSCGPVLRS